MGNVSLPTPVALAGAGLCVLGGYLLGVVTGPEAPARSTGVVRSYDAASGRLCIRGDEVAERAGEPEICGTWLPAGGPGDVPEPGDRVSFVSVVVDASNGVSEDDPGGKPGGGGPVTVIHGELIG